MRKHTPRARFMAIASLTALAVTGCGAQAPLSTTGATAPGATSSPGPTDPPSASAGPGGPQGTATPSSPAPDGEGPDSEGPNSGGPVASTTKPAAVAVARPTDQAQVLDSLPGRAGTRCAVVGEHTDLRSGSIAMGNFAAARRAFATQAGSQPETTVSLYVIPEHGPSEGGARVRIEPASGGATRVVKVVAAQTADVWRYYAVQLPVSDAGLWKVHAAVGPDRGCFLVRFD